MRSLATCLFILLVSFSVDAQADTLQLTVVSSLDQKMLGIFTFLPDGRLNSFIQRPPRNFKTGKTERKGNLMEVTYPFSGANERSRSQYFHKKDGRRVLGWTETTRFRNDSLIVSMSMANGRQLMRERIYEIDKEANRIKRLTTVDRKITKERTYYVTTKYIYEWKGADEVKITSDTADDPEYMVKRKNRGIELKEVARDKSKRYISLAFGKSNQLITFSDRSYGRSQISRVRSFGYARNEVLKYAMRTAIFNSRNDWLWFVKNPKSHKSIKPDIGKKMSEAVLEQLELDDSPYRLFFPRVLGGF